MHDTYLCTHEFVCTQAAVTNNSVYAQNAFCAYTDLPVHAVAFLPRVAGRIASPRVATVHKKRRSRTQRTAVAYTKTGGRVHKDRRSRTQKGHSHTQKGRVAYTENSYAHTQKRNVSTLHGGDREGMSRAQTKKLKSPVFATHKETL